MVIIRETLLTLLVKWTQRKARRFRGAKRIAFALHVSRDEDPRCSTLLHRCAFPSPRLNSSTETIAPPAQDSVDQAALMRDLTLTRSVDGRITMAMWMPDEFWRSALQSSGRMSEKGVADYMQTCTRIFWSR